MTDRFGSPRVSLRRRVAWMAAGYMVLVGVGQVSALASRARLDRTLEQQQQVLLPAQAAAARLETSVLNQRAAVLGFALTGEERFLAPYELGQRTEEEARTVLLDRLGGITELAAQVRELTSATRAWKTGVLTPALESVREGRAGDAATLISASGLSLFDPVRERSLRLTAALGQRVDADQEWIKKAESRLAALMLAGSSLGFVLSAASIWLLRLWVTQPVTALSAGVRRVAAGDLDQVIESSGLAELASLGADVEAMRIRILAELDTAVKAMEALEQGEPLVAALRSELVGCAGRAPDGWSVTSRTQAAEGVLAGDWFDLVNLANGRIVLAMVDISGHGPAAGLFAYKIKHLLRPALGLGMSPGEALGWVADQLGDTGDRFATCLVVELDPQTGSCRYANAGHPAGMICRAGDIEELGPSGPLLGPIEGTWLTKSTRLDQGDALVAYTDGLVEARSAAGEEFGVDRLRNIVSRGHHQAPEVVASELMAAVGRFGPARMADDATIVIISRLARLKVDRLDLVPVQPPSPRSAIAAGAGHRSLSARPGRRR